MTKKTFGVTTEEKAKLLRRPTQLGILYTYPLNRIWNNDHLDYPSTQHQGLEDLWEDFLCDLNAFVNLISVEIALDFGKPERLLGPASGWYCSVDVLGLYDEPTGLELAIVKRLRALIIALAETDQSWLDAAMHEHLEEGEK